MFVSTARALALSSATSTGRSRNESASRRVPDAPRGMSNCAVNENVLPAPGVLSTRIAAQPSWHFGVGREDDLDVLLAGTHPDHIGNVGEELVEIEVDALDLEVPGLDAREVEDVFDDRGEQPGGGANFLEVLAHLRR